MRLAALFVWLTLSATGFAAQASYNSEQNVWLLTNDVI